MGAFESGQAFLQSVLAKLPTELQGAAKDLFEKPEAKEALITIGDGALARSDYSKSMDTLKAKETELQEKLDNLTAWHDDNKAALAEYVVIKPEYDTLKAGRKPGDPDPTKPPVPPADPRAIVEEVLAAEGRNYVQISAWLSAKAVEHFHTFGTPLDVMSLASDPRLGKPIAGQPGRVVSLNDVYQEKFGPQLQEKAKAAEDKRIADLVEVKLKEERAKLVGHPYPLRDAAPSVLDVLSTKDGPAAHTLDSAVAEYDRLQAARG